MTHRSHRDDHGDRGGSQIPDSDPIVRPRPSCAVEPSRRHHVLGLHAGHGCGNADPVEITKRFPPDLGNLAQNARFPHFHSRFSSFRKENKDQNTARHAAACRAEEEARHPIGR